tara:strand:- start:15544 stop:16323 length:780 start_codon:yes stop_codon:yes gene_type:complete
MAKTNKKEPGYFKSLAAAAPVFGAKAVIGDLPKGAIEKAVDTKVWSKLSPTPGAKSPTWREAFKSGVKGRGLGRAIGAGTGVLTAPVYMKGIKLLGSKSKKDRKRGIAIIGGNTALYQLQKGVIEGSVENIQAGAGRASALKSAVGLGLGRLSYKVPAALIMAKGLASGEKKGKGNKGLATAMAGGALAGAVNRMGDEGFKEITKAVTAKGKAGYKFKPKHFGKRLVSGGMGGVAGGLLGGLVLSKAISYAKKSLKGDK